MSSPRTPRGASSFPPAAELVAWASPFGVDAQHLRAALDAVFQVGEQPLVGEVERVRMLPVVSRDLMEATHDLLVADFDRQLAPSVETAGREVDGADDR